MAYGFSGTPHFMTKALEKHCGAVRCLGPVTSLVETAARAFNKASRLVTGKRYDFVHSRMLSRRYARLFERKLRHAPVDVLFAPMASTEIAFLNTGLPVLYSSDTTFRGLKDYYPGFSNLLEFSAREADFMERSAIARARLLVYPSRWAAESAVRDYQADAAKVHVIPYGANLEDAPPAEAALRPRPSDVCRLLFVGVDWVRKGGDIAVETLTALHAMNIPAELTVCGCTPPAGLGVPGLRVIPFLDKGDAAQRRKLEDLYLGSHFLLLPTRNECYGIVFCEANAFGVPAIATDTGGVSEIIRQGRNGFMLPLAARGAEYADVIAGLWRDPGRYREMAADARSEFDHRLNWDAWAVAVGKLLREIVEIM